MNVAVLGASDKTDRYSYKAIKQLTEKGHRTFPVNPLLKNIDGVPVCKSIRDIPEPVDTLTVYLSAANSNGIAPDILASGARRVIFNPGAENPELTAQLTENNVSVLNACTLVMLNTEQF
ncbi:MAG: CoA-binding protein [Fibrobacterota bacterium]